MLKKVVIWCRSEVGDKEDLARQKQVLSLFCKENEYNVIRTYSEYGKADNLKLQMTNWENDFESQGIEGQKAMLFQVIEKINLFRDKVEIHINVGMDLFKDGLAEQVANNIDPIIQEPMVIEDTEVLPESIVAEQSNVGVVNCVSQAASQALVIVRSAIARDLQA